MSLARSTFVVQLARPSSSLVELPELSVLPVLPKLTELCSAAKNAPSMAWTAILTASLAYIAILAASLAAITTLAASLAALFWHYQLGVILAALLIQGSAINSRQRY